MGAIDVRAGALALAALILGGNAPEAARDVALHLRPGDVIPTGNDWIALPAIRANDGALESLNVTAMKYRGLVEMAGVKDQPLIAPWLAIDGTDRALAGLGWHLADYWVPTGTTTIDGIAFSVTYAAPPGSHAALARLHLVNVSDHRRHVATGMRVRWGATHRVTYSPEPLSGTRTMTPTPIDSDMAVFSYGTDDAQIAWGFGYVGSQAALVTGADPGLVARREADLAPGESLDVPYLIGAGLEEYSAAYAMRVLGKRIDREGIDGVIAEAADDAHRRTRTTGRADLDLLMNRNFLFTSYFAWGRAIDTEAFVGMTARSNRYYVSAAYWDRDALIWSFPALLDTDPARARAALDYALGVQGRNLGVHSRFIDGVTLEDGFELDELIAPALALPRYVAVTGDRSLLAQHAAVLAQMWQKLRATRDPALGLYATFQDAQDEYIRRPFSIADNVLVWRAFSDWATMLASGGDAAGAAGFKAEAVALHAAILAHGVQPGAPGADGPIFAAQVDAKGGDFLDVPPGSLMRMPALGFVGEDDPVFRRTYDWLHSPRYRYGFAGTRHGVPGSYRLPFTTSWALADHLRLARGRDRALEILLASPWDGGIITEGIRPDSAEPDHQGLAFATAAGYVAHTICDLFCIDRKAGAR